MVPKTVLRVLLMLLCITGFTPYVCAQYNANVQGKVTDTTGALIPGAEVVLTDKETNRVMRTTTNDTGDYGFNQLVPSTYKLDVTRDGFQPKHLENVAIRAEQSNRFDVQLVVGGEQQSVTVEANVAPVIDTATGQIAGAVNQEQISKLPSYGRDVFQLVQLAPGVFGEGSRDTSGGANALPGNQGPGGPGNSGGIFSTENRPQASANGGRPDQNNITLDGVSINSVTWGGAAVVTPSEDSIKELRVVANSYDAQFGRTSAAQVQAISQNGTNQFHGSAFFKADRPGLNAFQRFSPNGNPQRNTARFNQMGGTVGGPIWKDKLFFFFSYETIRNNSTTTGGAWFETPQVDQAAPPNSIASRFLGVPGTPASFSQILEGPNDQHTCADIGLVQGVNCNFIAGQGLDLGRPLSLPLGTRDPSYAGPKAPGLGGNGSGGPENFDGVPDLFFVATTSPFSQVSQQFNGRLDFQVTANDLVAFSVYQVPQDITNFNGPTRPSNLLHHNQVNYAQTALWNHIFSPSLINEARIDAAGWNWNEITANPQTPYGLPSANIALAGNSPSIGTLPTDAPQHFGPNVGSIFNQHTYSIRDVATKVVGQQNIKFGGEGTKLMYLDESTGNAQPTFYFNNFWDFLNDAPSAENATVDPLTGVPSTFRKDMRQNLFAFFVQDDWKARKNLTLNLGMRYEHFGGLYEKSGNLSTLRLGTGPNLLSGINFQQGGNQVNAPNANFGPQFGFAYSPGSQGKLVLRGGFGIGYSALELAILTNTRNNPPFLATSTTLTGPQIVYGTAADLFQFGAQPANPNLITSFDANGLPTAPGVSIGATGLPTDLPTQYTYRYSLQAEREIGRQWVASLGYQGSLGRHLPLQTNLNALFAPDVIAGTMAFNPRLNQITWFYNGGSSSFNALLGEVRHRFARTFEFSGQYRWSKSLDNGSGPFTVPNYEFGPTSLNWGPSDFDVRNYFKVWGLWSPRFFTGSKGWLEKVAGGWTLSGIVTEHSGFPWTPLYKGLGCNAVIPNTGQCDLLPAAYLGGGGNSQSTDVFKLGNGNFPNASGTTGADNVYFVAPTAVANSGTWPVTPTALPTLPGVRRNSFVGPRYFDVDATITKAFGLPTLPVLGEGARIELRANAYNLFNKLNLFSPDNNVTSPHFGQATQVLGGRTVELEAHFRF